jgi:transglutaminase-like putative cysteine protease
LVPLERFLDVRYGYCLQKALLGALILERAGVPHRVVHGAISRGPGDSGGHSWLELADGRVLDPAWALVTRPQSEGAPAPGTQYVGASWRYACATFPYLSVTEQPTRT